MDKKVTVKYCAECKSELILAFTAYMNHKISKEKLSELLDINFYELNQYFIQEDNNAH